jgi:tRNA threonylcarbamoyladenosine biosynthesis protein TsaB
MLIVAVDTSGKNGSLTLARANQHARTDLVETVALEGGTFSAQLIPQLAELLRQHGASKQEIGAFAVATGPGSFTGLRVGLAAVKGLAEVLRKPIVAVSLLEAVARTDEHAGRVLAALDAGRDEVYVGEYNDSVLAGEERLLGRAEFIESVTLKVFTTDAALNDALHASGRMALLVPHPGSAGIARLAWEKLRAGDHIAPEDLDANYIRRSDAEKLARSSGD